MKTLITSLTLFYILAAIAQGSEAKSFSEKLDVMMKGTLNGHYAVDDQFVTLHFSDSPLTHNLHATRKIGMTFGITKDEDFKNRREYVEGEEIAYIGYFEPREVINLEGRSAKISRAKISDRDLRQYKIYIMLQSGSTEVKRSGKREVFSDSLSPE